LVSGGIANGAATNGDPCEVIAGTHKGKFGTVGDWKLSKTGHASITVHQVNGDRFKTLARNVRVVRFTETAAR
jgi:ribosomal protein S4E